MIILLVQFYACLGRKAYCYRKGSKLWKTVFIKNMFENGWWGDASPTSPTIDPPLPAPITTSLTTTTTSWFGFIMMWGKFCHICFEITARTAVAQFGHFTLKTRVRFQKEGFDPPNPRGCATACVLSSIGQITPKDF